MYDRDTKRPLLIVTCPKYLIVLYLGYLCRKILIL
jgi:hypothetical protein